MTHHESIRLHEIPPEVLESFTDAIVPGYLLPAQASTHEHTHTLAIVDDAELENESGVSRVLSSTLILNALLVTPTEWVNTDTIRDYIGTNGHYGSFNRWLEATRTALKDITDLEEPILQRRFGHQLLKLDDSIVFEDRRLTSSHEIFRRRTGFHFDTLEAAGDNMPHYKTVETRQNIFATMIKDFQDNPEAKRREHLQWIHGTDKELPEKELSAAFASIDTALAAYLCTARDEATVGVIIEGIEAYHRVVHSIQGHIQRLAVHFGRSFPDNYQEFVQAAELACIPRVLGLSLNPETGKAEYFYEQISKSARGAMLRHINALRANDNCLQWRQYELYQRVKHIVERQQGKDGSTPAMPAIQEQLKELYDVAPPANLIERLCKIALKEYSPAFSLDSFATTDGQGDLHNIIPASNAEAQLELEIDKLHIADAMEMVFGPDSNLSDTEKVSLSLKFAVFSPSLAYAEIRVRGRADVFEYPSSETDFYTMLRDVDNALTYKSLEGVANLTASGMHLAVKRGLVKAHKILAADEALVDALKSML